MKGFQQRGGAGAYVFMMFAGFVAWALVGLALYFAIIAIIREIKKPSPPQTRERFAEYN